MTGKFLWGFKVLSEDSGYISNKKLLLDEKMFWHLTSVFFAFLICKVGINLYVTQEDMVRWRFWESRECHMRSTEWHTPRDPAHLVSTGVKSKVSIKGANWSAAGDRRGRNRKDYGKRLYVPLAPLEMIPSATRKGSRLAQRTHGLKHFPCNLYNTSTKVLRKATENSVVTGEKPRCRPDYSPLPHHSPTGGQGYLSKKCKCQTSVKGKEVHGSNHSFHPFTTISVPSRLGLCLQPASLCQQKTWRPEMGLSGLHTFWKPICTQGSS